MKLAQQSLAVPRPRKFARSSCRQVLAMSMKFIIRVSLLGSFFAGASCGGSSGASGTAPAPPNPVTAEVRSITIPSFPHEVDIYSVVGATRAIVFLHGGGGTNDKFAFDLGINLVNASPRAATANATWLANNEVVAVFPQGQATSGLVYTWNNHAMNSGQDDIAFLQALATVIKTEYGVSDVYLLGHSNGGMMVNRFWCESPTTFKAYLSLAGPASSYYLGDPCSPTLAQPYFGLVGDQDLVLQVPGNWAEVTWEVEPLLAADFVNATLIGEWYQHRARSQLMCGEAPVLLDATRENQVDTWSNCGDRIVLQRFLGAGHAIASLEGGSVDLLIDRIVDFVNRVEPL